MQDGDQEVIGITEHLVSEHPEMALDDDDALDGTRTQVRSYEAPKVQIIDQVQITI
jgi:hypothetical protein